jgi:hypothetical protein
LATRFRIRDFRPDGTGYSRLTDGDTETYWKSNPYLSKAFTGEDDSLHPQWVVVDLAKPQDINAIRIHCADPYARQYLVQYWTGLDAVHEATKGSWVTFPGGVVTNGTGGATTLQLSRAPISARFRRPKLLQGKKAKPNLRTLGTAFCAPYERHGS